MRGRLPLRWCVPTFLVGVVLGLGLEAWTSSHSALARPGEKQPADADVRPDSPLAQTSHQLARVAAEVTPSVVHIETRLENPTKGLVEETGSGVIVSSPRVPGYFVVTNRHVIGDATSFEQTAIRLSDGRSYHPSKKWVDVETDLAVLKIEAETARPARWGNSDRLEIGNLVLAVGSPFGLSQSVTMGIVSARGRALHLGRRAELVNQDFIQTDAAINFGNSGGPLVDVEGRVVGINTAIASNSGGNDGIGFSIPSNLARRVVNDLLERGQVRRAYLGVMLDPDFTPEKARDLKMDRVRGARIARVYPGSPAARASLAENDVILSFDGVDVVDENHLINLVSLTEIGRKVLLVVLHDGRKMTVEVQLSNRQELDKQSEAPTRPGTGSIIRQLGLRLHDVTPGLARQLGLAQSMRGVLVLGVDPASSLWGVVDVYDVLEEIGRTPVNSIADVERTVQSPHGELLLRFSRRSGQTQRSHVVVWRP